MLTDPLSKSHSLIPTHKHFLWLCMFSFSHTQSSHRDVFLKIILLVIMMSANLERMRYEKDPGNKIQCPGLLAVAHTICSRKFKRNTKKH